MTEKIKCWVVKDSQFPGGVIYERRSDALDYSAEMRNEYNDKAYTRVKYFTREELNESEEL